MAEIGVVPGGGLPFGDIVQAKTPFTDQVSAALLAQNADRRKYQQETTQRADEQMTKELANVRSADMNQVVDSYGKWKNISMQMLNPKVQADPKLYNQLQQQKNAALGQTMSDINRSAQLNAQAKELVAERKTKPSLYNDDFGDRLAEFNKTPMNQLQNHPKYGDLTNPDAFRYQGSQTDFGKLEASAAGKFQPISGAEKTEVISPLQKRITPTEFGSTPTQFFENMKGQLAQHIPGRDAAAAWEAVPDQQKAAVDQQFAAISPDKWQAMTGVAKPQVIAPADPNNPAENYAAYRAKVYAINSAPRAGTPRVETNEAAKLATQFDQRKALEVLKQGGRKEILGMRQAYQSLKTGEQSKILDQTFKDVLDQGIAGGLLDSKAAGGSNFKEYDLGAYTALNKDFAILDDKGHAIYPDTYRLSADKKTVRPVFFESGEEVKPGQMKAIFRDRSKPIPVSVFKALVGKELFGTREAAKESGTPTTTGASGITWQ